MGKQGQTSRGRQIHGESVSAVATTSTDFPIYDQFLKGADVAVASTITLPDTRDYWHVTGNGGSISFIATTRATGQALLDGVAFELFAESLVVLVDAAGSPPGGTVHLLTGMSSNTNIPAGHVARFRYDVAKSAMVLVSLGPSAGFSLPADQVAVGNGTTLVGSNDFQFNAARGLFLNNRVQEAAVTATMSGNTLVLGAGNQNFFRGTADIHGIAFSGVWQVGSRVTVTLQASAGGIVVRNFSGTPGAGAESIGTVTLADITLPSGSLVVFDLIFNADNSTWMQVDTFSSSGVTIGSGTVVPVLTIDAFGRIIGRSTAPIHPSIQRTIAFLSPKNIANGAPQGLLDSNADNAASSAAFVEFSAEFAFDTIFASLHTLGRSVPDGTLVLSTTKNGAGDAGPLFTWSGSGTGGTQGFGFLQPMSVAQNDTWGLQLSYTPIGSPVSPSASFYLTVRAFHS